MRENTPVPYPEHSNDARACQYPDGGQSGKTSLACPRTGMIDTSSIIAAVARAYNDTYPAADVTPDAIVRLGRTPHLAQARHLCAYLLVEDYYLTNMAATHAVGRTDHTTVINSRARIATGLAHDVALQRTLAGARDILSGRARRDTPRRDLGRRRAFAAASPQELAEYRYWRLRSLHADAGGSVR